MLRRLKELYWAVTTQFGLQPSVAWRALKALPSFVADARQFRKNYSGPLRLMPFLHDRNVQAGDAHSEYFLQDLEVAKRIFKRSPSKHVDVGSRIDGFVAHVAAFRAIEVFDIRPVAGKVLDIVFKQADLMNHQELLCDYCDSLSCLHAIEHFGLGRYGDMVNPSGWKLGIQSLSRILQRGGRLYLSAPVGVPTVIFNAHRIFAPSQLLEAGHEYGLKFDHLSWVADGKVHTSTDLASDLSALGRDEYALGIFEFIKL